MLIVAASNEAGSVQDHEVSHERCRVQSTTYEGWRAEEMSNEWVIDDGKNVFAKR
jgi:hypothetical protein